MASSTSGTAPAQSQPVSFTTRTAYPLPTQKFLIPTTWKRYQLSQLVNKALSLSRVVPLDFLVRGEILRTSLGEWCAEHGVGEVSAAVYLISSSINHVSIGRDAWNWIHRVGPPASKAIGFSSWRLGIIRLLPNTRVSVPIIMHAFFILTFSDIFLLVHMMALSAHSIIRGPW